MPLTPATCTTAPRLWRYQLVLLFATLPLFLYTLRQAIGPGRLRYLKQRLGFGFPVRSPANNTGADTGTDNNQPVWLHAASVGEVLAAGPLIRMLHRANPDIPLLITTMTPTGAQMTEQHFAAIATHCYLPIDWRGATHRFVKAMRPRCALIMETELWPNLYAACGQQGIKPVIVNGRISLRTLDTGHWIRQLYQATLQQVNVVLARSEQDADRFLALGADPDRVKVIGNIKFGIATRNTKSPGPLPSIPATLSLPRPFVLVASTHDDEELHIARRWLAAQSRDLLLVIAPRHPKRSGAIIKQLQTLSVPIAVRSRNENIGTDTAIYLADTLGELLAFYKEAELVIMGGSFVPVGGHNMLEPAMLGKAIIFGPHMHNFADEADGLLAQHAALQVNNYDELGRQLNRLLNDPAKRQALGERARLFMNQNSDIAERYLCEIAAACPAAGIRTGQP